MLPYATSDDLNGWLGSAVTAPADPDRLLARASNVVDGMVRAPFDVDGDGIATDETVAGALRDATCAVVEQWMEVDEANDIDGLASTPVTTTGHSGQRAPRWCPRAIEILRNAGLTQLPVTRSYERDEVGA